MATRILRMIPWLRCQITRRRASWQAKQPELPNAPRSPRRPTHDDHSPASLEPLPINTRLRDKTKRLRNNAIAATEPNLGTAENPLRTPSLRAPTTSESAESGSTPQIADDILLRVSVYSESGQRAYLALPPDLMGHRLKIECMYLFGEIGTDPAAFQLMVLDASGETLGREVADGQTLYEAALLNHDEIFLMRPVVFVETIVHPFVRGRACDMHFNPNTFSADPMIQRMIREKSLPNFPDPYEPFPSAADIGRATSHLPRRSQSVNGGPAPVVVNIEELVLQTDIQFNIRQILISLSVTSACIIGMGTNARRLIDMFKMRLTASMQKPGTGSEEAYRDAVLQQLVDMGFGLAASIAGLERSNGDAAQALRWLIDEPCETASTGAETASVVDPSDESNADAIADPNMNPTAFVDRDSQLSPKRYRNVEALHTIIRVYSRKTLPAPDDMVRIIGEMGFEKPDVIEALKITKNNYVAACEWLHGKAEKRRRKGATTAMDGHNRLGEMGLPADSPLLLILLSSPTVQATLSKPKMFIAYLAILEDYSAMNVWLSDGETAGCIGHIMRTYHEHKHLQAINHTEAQKQTRSNATV